MWHWHGILCWSQTISDEQFGRLCEAASSNSRLEGLLCSNTHMGDTYAEKLVQLIESNPNIKEIRWVTTWTVACTLQKAFTVHTVNIFYPLIYILGRLTIASHVPIPIDECYMLLHATALHVWLLALGFSIESNFISPPMIARLVKALLVHKSVETFRAANQVSNIPDSNRQLKSKDTAKERPLFPKWYTD